MHNYSFFVNVKHIPHRSNIFMIERIYNPYIYTTLMNVDQRLFHKPMHMTQPVFLQTLKRY